MGLYKKLYFYLRIAKLLITKQVITPGQIQADYDELSERYETYFADFVKKHSLKLVDKLEVKEGIQALDLACGAGTISFALADKVEDSGKVYGVDLSGGMLDVAKRKQASLKIKNIEFLQGDMLKKVKEFPANTFDIVTCGWAIGYVPPYKLLREIRRILKVSGKVGIIENIRDTLRPIRCTATKVAQEYPKDVVAVMNLHLRLPKNKKHLKKFFIKVNLQPLEIWEGKEEFHFKDGKEVLAWVLKTGASAGFDRMMNPEKRKECDESFKRIINRDYLTKDGITIAHRYVAGIARKGREL